MATFGRRNLPAARAYVAAAVARGDVAAGRKGAREYTPDYLVRLANSIERDREAGVPPSRQRARRGPITFARPGGGEHPRQRHVGTAEAGHESREYRRVRSMRRFVDERIPGGPDALVQITAQGVPVEGYDALASAAAIRVWRILYTGPAGAAPWDRIAVGAHHPDGRRLFDSILTYEVRWGSAIDDSPALYPAL